MNTVSPGSAGSLRFLVLATLAALVPAAAQAVVPVPFPTPVLDEIAINAGPGDQNDPHVDGDWVSYTSDNRIRYYRFSTGVDAEIPPGDSVQDTLSDISGSRIVFCRIVAGVGTAVMVFDAVTGAPPVAIDPAPGTNRLGAAIGGDTVAYVDFGLQMRGELVVHDLATSTSVRITADTAFDQNPAVSPDGNVVAWEHCPASTGNCDIWQAVKSNGAWTASAAAATSNPESNPDSDGTLLLYDARSGNSLDLLWRPVAGGPEARLELSSVERAATVAGGLVAFEGQADLFASTDVFVYDTVNNRLFQITDTPLVHEQLSDITRLPDGRLRVVWASDEDGPFTRNVRAATFELPNVAATLSHSTEGGYGTDGVSPDSGTTATTFTYKVVYTDFEDQAPSFVDVCIDGTCHGMAVDTAAAAPLQDGDYRNGEQYEYTTTLAAGPHAYFFEASDGTAPARLPAAGSLSGPSVQGASAAAQITDLIALLRSFNVSKPVSIALEVVLVIARALVNGGHPSPACFWMNVFIAGVQLQTGHAITAAQAAQLIAAAEAIKATLGCP